MTNFLDRHRREFADVRSAYECAKRLWKQGWTVEIRQHRDTYQMQGRHHAYSFYIVTAERQPQHA